MDLDNCPRCTPYRTYRQILTMYAQEHLDQVSYWEYQYEEKEQAGADGETLRQCKMRAEYYRQFWMLNQTLYVHLMNLQETVHENSHQNNDS